MPDLRAAAPFSGEAKCGQWQGGVLQGALLKAKPAGVGNQQSMSLGAEGW